MPSVAVVGLGPMGQRHVKAISEMEQMTLAGVVDLNENAVQQTLSEYKLPLKVGYGDYEKMLDEVKPQILIISTNGPSHFNLFNKAVDAGVKKILMEKPIAVSISEAKEMQRMAKEQTVKLLVNHSRRWCSDYVQLKAKLKSGIIGDVRSVSLHMGGGQMACNGTHYIDLVSFLIDQSPAQVVGYVTDLNTPNPRGNQFKDPGGYAVIHFVDGVRMFFEMPEDIGIPPIMTIHGTYGRIVIDEMKREYIIQSRLMEDRTIPITRYGTPLKHTEVVHIHELDLIKLSQKAIQMLAENAEDSTCQHAIDSLEAIIGIHLSHEQGNTPIQLPLVDEKAAARKYQFT